MSIPIRTVSEYNFAGSRARLLMSGNDTAGAFSIMEMFAPPGKSTPRHRHEAEDETVLVLEGTVDVTIAEELVRVHAGENVSLPRHLPHRIANNGTQPARYLLVCTPAGFDAFIDSCATAHAGPVTPTPPGPDEIARMRAAAPRFGITLLPD